MKRPGELNKENKSQSANCAFYEAVEPLDRCRTMDFAVFVIPFRMERSFHCTEKEIKTHRNPIPKKNL